jgi:hypothetical protein
VLTHSTWSLFHIVSLDKERESMSAESTQDDQNFEYLSEFQNKSESTEKNCLVYSIHAIDQNQKSHAMVCRAEIFYI